MTTVIIIGNLTKDAEVKETKEGRKYVLLQLAENIRKRDDKGNFIKDDNGHYDAKSDDTDPPIPMILTHQFRSR